MSNDWFIFIKFRWILKLLEIFNFFLNWFIFKLECEISYMSNYFIFDRCNLKIIILFLFFIPRISFWCCSSIISFFIIFRRIEYWSFISLLWTSRLHFILWLYRIFKILLFLFLFYNSLLKFRWYNKIIRKINIVFLIIEVVNFCIKKY